MHPFIINGKEKFCKKRRIRQIYEAIKKKDFQQIFYGEVLLQRIRQRVLFWKAGEDGVLRIFSRCRIRVILKKNQTRRHP